MNGSDYVTYWLRYLETFLIFIGKLLGNGRFGNFKAKVSELRQRPEKDEDGAGCMNGSVVDLKSK